MNKKNIVKEAKDFVGEVRKAINMVGNDELFTVAVGSSGGCVRALSVSKFTTVKVGQLAEEKYPDLFAKANQFLEKMRSEVAPEICGVFILLCDEHDVDISRSESGTLLRISNLNA